MIHQHIQGRALLTTALLAVCLLSSPPLKAASEDGLIAIRDLHFGETLYHFYQKKYFTAISDLMVAQVKHPITTQGHDPELLMGGLYLSYNMSNPASQIFEQLAKQETDKSIHSSVWYYLARIDYEKNNYIQAQQAIDKVTQTLPFRYNDEFQHLRSNILLKQKKYKQAISVLENFSGSTEWSNYSKFNLAIALVMSGEEKQGIDLLEEVASIETIDLEQTALRDKANLALGYSALRAKLHDTAAGYFKQVRLVGSQSNKALLGIGWAYHKEGKLERSLVPWIELKNRNSKDPAVQEALLTIPHALEGLNAKEQALAYYNNAINSYNTELTSINKVVKAVKSGEFSHSLRDLHLYQQDENHLHYTKLPDSIATPYLQGLIAEQDFQNILKTYRDLLYMKNILIHWKNQMPAYKLMLSERQKAYQSRVPLITSFHKNTRQTALTLRYEELNDRFNQITNHTDVLALANEKEISLLKRLDRIKQTLDRSTSTELTKQREQLKFFRGLIYWQIASDFSPRQWQIKKQLNQIQQAFTEMENKKKSSLSQLVKTPKYFSNFAQNIKSKNTQIRYLSARIEETIKQQENLINRLAIDNLQQQRRQIENYHIRASYSLTRLYDSLAAVEKKP